MVKHQTATMWQNTLEYYQTWNKIERHYRTQPQDLANKWQEFLALVEFGLEIKPEPSLHEQRQKMNSLNTYYQQIQLFEQRRQQHGQSY